MTGARRAPATTADASPGGRGDAGGGGAGSPGPGPGPDRAGSGTEEWTYGDKPDRYRFYHDLLDEWGREGVVLDVGCGPCDFTRQLAAAGREVVGLDADPSRFDTTGLDVRACDVEVDRFPVADESVATAFLTEVIEHLGRDPVHALRETWRVLEAGGRLLVTTPNLYACFRVWRLLTGRGTVDAYEEFTKLHRFGHPGHVHVYARAELVDLLEAVGFDVRRSTFADFAPAGSLPGSLLRRVPCLKPTIVVVCERPAVAAVDAHSHADAATGDDATTGPDPAPGEVGA